MPESRSTVRFRRTFHMHERMLGAQGEPHRVEYDGGTNGSISIRHTDDITATARDGSRWSAPAVVTGTGTFSLPAGSRKVLLESYDLGSGPDFPTAIVVANEAGGGELGRNWKVDTRQFSQTNWLDFIDGLGGLVSHFPLDDVGASDPIASTTNLVFDRLGTITPLQESGDVIEAQFRVPGPFPNSFAFFSRRNHFDPSLPNDDGALEHRFTSPDNTLATDHLDADQDWTTAIWFRILTRDTGGQDYDLWSYEIDSQQDVVRIGWDRATAKVQFQHNTDSGFNRTSGGVGPVILPANESGGGSWNLVTFKRDRAGRGDLVGYVNGVEVWDIAIVAADTFTLSTDGNMGFGQFSRGDQNYAHAHLSNWVFFDRALTDTEILQLYSTGVS